MSYSFSVRVEDDGTITVPEGQNVGQYAPRGNFSISGHVVKPGESGTQSLVISAPNGQQASGYCALSVPIPAAPEVEVE